MNEWYTTKEICSCLGVSRRTVGRMAVKNSWEWDFVTKDGRSHKVYKVCKDDLLKKAEQEKTTSNKKDFVVINSYYKNKQSDEEILQDYLDETERKISQSPSGHIDIGIKESLPTGIVFISDNHMGEYAWVKRMIQDAKHVADTEGLYAVFGGDGWDNYIKHFTALVNKSSKPSSEYKAFRAYLRLFNSKILAMISGNHDGWTKDYSGMDMVEYLADELDIEYSPNWKATINIHFVDDLSQDETGNFTILDKDDERSRDPYTILLQHKSRWESGLNPEHACRATLQRGDVDADIVCIGHKHVMAAFPFMLHGKERWGFRPGSYKQMDNWGKQHGFVSDPPTCPTAIIYPDNSKKIIGLKDVKDAVTFIKAERESWKKSKSED